MGFLDFLKKKPVASTQPAAASIQPAPTATGMSTSAHLDLPELPSFDASSTNGMSGDLPPLPSFDDATSMSSPANFSLPQIPTFENAGKPTLKAPNSLQTTSSAAAQATKAVSEPQSMSTMTPPSFPTIEEEPIEQSQTSKDQDMPAIDARTPFGPVFCDVETYRAILSNMTHAKDEVIQLQSFSENSLKLHARTQTQYDDFHNTLSMMAKKLLLAEAKLFK